MVPLAKPYFTVDELQEIELALRSGWVSKGPRAKALEEKAEQILGVKKTVSVCNCTAALHLSLLALGIGPGDEVILPSYTYPATGLVVLYCGAKPVFVDVDPDTYNVNPFLIEEAITPATKAIIPVNLFGQMARMDLIMKLAASYNLSVVEDSACSFGSSYKGKSVWGDISCFSFHARKGITTGEGGLIATDDEKLAEKIRILSMFGAEGGPIQTFKYIGYNYKMSDINAAVGLVQMEKLYQIIKRKQELAEYYSQQIRIHLPNVRPPFIDKNGEHVWQTYAVFLEMGNRDKIIEELKKMDIGSQIGTYAIHLEPVFREYSVDVSLPTSEFLFDNVLALPFYYKITKKDIDEVIKVLKKWT